MWIRLLANKMGYLNPHLLRLVGHFYLPFLGAGIRIAEVADDYRYMRVELPLTFWNRNYVGVQFGGSIYAMTDPFYMLMLMQILGHEYIVWDQAARVEFLKPGRSRLKVEFKWTEDEIESIRKATASGEKLLVDKPVEIVDLEGVIVARVLKTLYIRKKKAKI